MYDVLIIGAGVSGLFTAISFGKKTKILLLEAGPALKNRATESHIGFGGLGLSEGKYNFSLEFGGALAEKIGSKQAREAMLLLKNILNKETKEPFLSYHTAKPLVSQTPIKFIENETYHLGTNISQELFETLEKNLSDNITIKYDDAVFELKKHPAYFSVVTNNQQVFTAKKVIVATGANAEFTERLLKDFKLKHSQQRLDLGIRLEMPANQLDVLLHDQREVKMTFGSSYTYCMNKFGRIIPKTQLGVIMPDGQNYRENGPSKNLNFTLFTPFFFKTHQLAQEFLTETFQSINQQTQHIVGQRLNAILPEWPAKSLVEPTIPFHDVSLLNYVPAKVYQNTLAFLKALSELLGQHIDGSSILYGLDAKFYQPAVETDQNFQTKVPNLFVIGDSSGVTWSLSHAAASGLHVATTLDREE